MTPLPDLINGAFECFGGVFLVLNIRTLLRDKQVKGIHWGSTIFFTSWSLWNMWYYPHLDQWASFYGGLFICAANVVWLSLRLYYSRRQRLSARLYKLRREHSYNMGFGIWDELPQDDKTPCGCAFWPGCACPNPDETT